MLILAVAHQTNAHDSDNLSKTVCGAVGVHVTSPASPPSLLRLLTNCLITKSDRKVPRKPNPGGFQGNNGEKKRSPLPPAASWTEECSPASRLLATVNPFWQALKCGYSLAAQTLPETGAGICPAWLGSLECVPFSFEKCCLWVNHNIRRSLSASLEQS